MTDYNSIDFTPLIEASADEVITESFVRDVTLPTGGTLALITLDNGRDHTRPNTLGPRTLQGLAAVLDALTARAAAGEIAAVAITGKPFIFAAGADLSKVQALGTRENALLMAQYGHHVLGKLHTLGVPSFAFVNGLALGGAMEMRLPHGRFVRRGIGLPRGLPRHHPGLGRRDDRSEPHRYRERPRGHRLEPSQEQPNAEARAGAEAWPL